MSEALYEVADMHENNVSLTNGFVSPADVRQAREVGHSARDLLKDVAQPDALYAAHESTTCGARARESRCIRRIHKSRTSARSGSFQPPTHAARRGPRGGALRDGAEHNDG